MIPSIPTHSNTSTPSNQDHLYLSPQQPQQQQQQQRILQQQQQPEVIEHGTRDQQSDALVSDLNNQFEKCQHLLNSIAASLSTKAMMVEGQRRKLEESEQLLNQWRDLIAKYRSSVVELVKSEA